MPATLPCCYFKPLPAAAYMSQYFQVPQDRISHGTAPLSRCQEMPAHLPTADSPVPPFRPVSLGAQKLEGIGRVSLRGGGGGKGGICPPPPWIPSAPPWILTLFCHTAWWLMPSLHFKHPSFSPPPLDKMSG